MTPYPIVIVTPEREMFRGEAQMLILRGTLGDMGVLAHHQPLVTGVEPCVVHLRQSDGEHRLAASGGFLEVRSDGVTLLLEGAEWPEDIDVDRARRALERAEARLSSPGPDVDRPRAQRARLKALARLEVRGQRPESERARAPAEAGAAHRT